MTPNEVVNAMRAAAEEQITAMVGKPLDNFVHQAFLINAKVNDIAYHAGVDVQLVLEVRDARVFIHVVPLGAHPSRPWWVQVHADPVSGAIRWRRADGRLVAIPPLTPPETLVDLLQASDHADPHGTNLRSMSFARCWKCRAQGPYSGDTCPICAGPIMGIDPEDGAHPGDKRWE